jgi:hypothetical protein
MNGKKLLSLWGLKWNPFSPELPSEGLLVTPKIESFAWRLEQLVQEGGFALISGESGTGKSVALRIVAHPGEANYGRLSVMLQYRCECQYLLDVAPTSFKPPPKVDSAVIRLIPYRCPKHEVGDYSNFYSIVQAAFSQRRKTISNSLKSILDRETIIACEIDPGLRAENLAVADFANLSRACS